MTTKFNLREELEKLLNSYKINTIPKADLIDKELYVETKDFTIYSRRAVKHIVEKLLEQARLELLGAVTDEKLANKCECCSHWIKNLNEVLGKKR